jgi:hypothetical protein
MIPQDHHGRRSKPFDVAKDLEGIWSSVHEVADEPESIEGGIETDLIDQALQASIASLNITDRKNGHWKRKRVTWPASAPKDTLTR